MPGGGFLQHTLTALLEPTGAKPVHRLGRFTSGLQVCCPSQKHGRSSAGKCSPRAAAAALPSLGAADTRAGARATPGDHNSRCGNTFAGLDLGTTT